MCLVLTVCSAICQSDRANTNRSQRYKVIVFKYLHTRLTCLWSWLKQFQCSGPPSSSLLHIFHSYVPLFSNQRGRMMKSIRWKKHWAARVVMASCALRPWTVWMQLGFDSHMFWEGRDRGYNRGKRNGKYPISSQHQPDVSTDSHCSQPFVAYIRYTYHSTMEGSKIIMRLETSTLDSVRFNSIKWESLPQLYHSGLLASIEKFAAHHKIAHQEGSKS